MISVTYASYGRRNRYVCQHSNIRTTSCHASSSLSKLMAKYNGRFSCEIHASNSVFGDPCYGSFKYLSVRYICIWKVSGYIWEVFLWSGSRLELWLGNGWKMALSNITKIQCAQDFRSPYALFGLLLQWYRLTLLACPFFCFSPFPKTENFISSYTRPPRNSAMYLVGIEKIAWKVFQFFLFYYRRGIKKIIWKLICLPISLHYA